MKPECRNDCVEPLLFPKRIHNRPGLSHIDYRIGSYADFLEAMLRDLNTNEVLQAWTHRESDDPAIALMEGASILGDILTFYQELYANEVHLRTATWRESVAGLVRLLGYRLSPGVGGKATFAFEVEGGQPVSVVSGFPLKVELDEFDEPADFEVQSGAVVYPALSKFHLYRPRRSAQPIRSGLSRLEIDAVDGKSDSASIESVELTEGDRILLVPDASVFDTPGTQYAAQQNAEILIVSEVTRILDRTVVKFDGALTQDRPSSVTAYRIDRKFRHFGHDTPGQLTVFDDSTQRVDQEPVQFIRNVYGKHPITSSGSVPYSELSAPEMPLDREVDDLAEGGNLICQGEVSFLGQATAVPFTVIRAISSVRPNHLAWGGLTGPATVVSLKSKLIGNSDLHFPKIDIRKLNFYETVGPVMKLRGPAEWDDGAFSGRTLNFHGKHADAAALASRRVAFVHQDGTVQYRTVTNKKSDFSLRGRDGEQEWLWPVALDAKPDPFPQQDFDEQEEKRKVTVYGNLIDASQGKTEMEAVLGNGDSRETFQTFKIPKAPLTYHTSVGETPPEVPELEIYVDDRLWVRVPTLFNRSMDEEVYIVREDDDGDSWVQFGDGKSGRRLPSGLDNVVARYRTGVGAYGRLKPDTTVQAGDRLDGLEAIQLPGIVSGGDEPESGENARKAAPGRIQSLDRLVSLEDFESEALAIAGVSKVRASWDLVRGVPTLILVVLMETGREGEISQIRRIMNTYNSSRGPHRFPLEIQQGKFKPVSVAANVAIDSTYRRELVLTAIEEALGVHKEQDNRSVGLFAIENRTFGQNEYKSKAAGAIQNVDGVLWTKITKFNGPPSTSILKSVIHCDLRSVLRLDTDDLQLSPVGAATEQAT
jgi:hypothetical protein